MRETLEMQGPEELGLRDGLEEVGQLSASQVLGPPTPNSPGVLALVSMALEPDSSLALHGSSLTPSLQLLPPFLCLLHPAARGIL